MKKIFVLILSIYLSTAQTLIANNHKWYAGDIARVVSMCNSDNVLRLMADLMLLNTKQDDILADELWLEALRSGECVYDGRYVYQVMLTEKLEVFKNLYGIGEHGELWQATVMLPSGRFVIVYIGLLEHKAPTELMDQSLKPRIQS